MLMSEGRIIVGSGLCGGMRNEVGFAQGMTYMWANQHGKRIRVFCHICGGVTDLIDIYNKPLEIRLQKWFCKTDAIQFGGK